MRTRNLARCALGFGAALCASAACAQDIPAGWSVDVKPKRAIMSFAPEAGGPRYLIVACLRDTDEILPHQDRRNCGALNRSRVGVAAVVDSAQQFIG